MVERSLQDVRGLGPGDQLPDGRRVIDQEWYRKHLARVHAELEFPGLIELESGIGRGRRRGSSTSPTSSSIKVFGTEFNLSGHRAP